MFIIEQNSSNQSSILTGPIDFLNNLKLVLLHFLVERFFKIICFENKQRTKDLGQLFRFFGQLAAQLQQKQIAILV